MGQYKIEEWRHRPTKGEYPYFYLDGIVTERTWDAEVRNVSLLVTSAVNKDGYRESLGICEGATRSKGSSEDVTLPRGSDWCRCRNRPAGDRL